MREFHYGSALATATLWRCSFFGHLKPKSGDCAKASVSSARQTTGSSVLTASGKDGSPAMLAQSELSVSVDKQPAQVNALRSAKNDTLLFAVLVDISKSDAANADLVRKAALQLFQSLASGGNHGYLVLFSDIIAIGTGPLQISQVQRA